MVLIFDKSSFEFLFAPVAPLRDALLSAPSPIATRPQTRNSALPTRPPSPRRAERPISPNIAQYRLPPCRKPRFLNHNVAPNIAQYRPISGFQYTAHLHVQNWPTPPPDNAQQTTHPNRPPRAGTDCFSFDFL